MKNIFVITLLMCCYTHASSQAAIGLDNQRKESPGKINLIFNQPKYSPGDTAFFKGFFWDTETATSKRVVNINLIDNNGHATLHNRLLFTNGKCVNQIVLPNAIRAGVYTLIAYLDDTRIASGYSSFLYYSTFIIAGEKEFQLSGAENLKFDTLAAVKYENSVNVTLTFDRKQYRTRQKVTANVTVKDSNNNPVYANLTVTVVKEDLFPARAFKMKESIRYKSDSLRESTEAQRVSPYYFKGKVVQSNNMLSDSTLITFYLNREDFIYGVYPTRGGEFEFPLFKDFGNDEVFYRITSHGHKLDGALIVLDTPLIKVEPVTYYIGDVDMYGAYSDKAKKIYKSYAYYSKSANIARSKFDFADEIDADYVVDMNKFEPFLTMADALGNIIQAVKYKKNKDIEGVRVFLKSQGYYATADPVYIIDGIMTDNTDFFLRLDPSKISKIKVIRSASKLSRYGVIGINGIIVLETKILDQADLMRRTATSLFVTGINKILKFNNQPEWKYSGPDIRTSLYWNPEIATGDSESSEFSFYTSDATGNFRVRVEGFTVTGVPLIYEKGISVVFDPNFR